MSHDRASISVIARTAAALALVAAAIVVGRPAAAGHERHRIAVIVHPARGARALSRTEVAAVFLGRAVEWPDGTRVRPIDQLEGSPAREAFTRDVLRRSSAAVRAVLQQLVFSGRGVPPPEAASDAAVIAHVRAHRGGIGYVSLATPLDGVVEIDLGE